MMLIDTGEGLSPSLIQLSWPELLRKVRKWFLDNREARYAMLTFRMREGRFVEFVNVEQTAATLPPPGEKVVVGLVPE
jgi:hypothetical protein